VLAFATQQAGLDRLSTILADHCADDAVVWFKDWSALRFRRVEYIKSR
jgi:hypothetical protein